MNSAPLTSNMPPALDMKGSVFANNAAQQNVVRDDIDMRSLLLMLWRRRRLVVAVIICGMALSLFSLRVVTPVYKARAVILVEAPSAGLVSLKRPLLGGGTGGDIMGELEIIRSRSFVAKVLKRLGVYTDPTAAQDQDDSSFKALSVYGAELKVLPPEVADPEIAQAITEFQDVLSARILPGSSALQIEFRASRPDEAARVANIVADTYLLQRAQHHQIESQKLKNWLDEKLEILRIELREKELAMQAYKAEMGLIDGAAGTVGDDQLSSLYTQLARAKTDKAAIQARLSYLDDVSAGKASLESAPETLRSDIIRKLKIEAVRFEGAISELSKRYGAKHPQMIKAAAELNDLNRAIRDEMSKSAQGAKTDLTLAEAHIASLEDSLAEIKNRNFAQSGDTLALLELRREAEAIGVALEGLMKNYALADQRALLNEGAARIISHAAVPTSAAFPNKKLILGLGTMLSVFTALALALLFEKMDTRLRSARQLETVFKYPCIGLIPTLKGFKPGPEMADYPLRHPASGLAEAVRSLRMHLKLNLTKTEDQPAKVMAITSSFAGEGKTTLSVWLARLAAKSGERVILVDMDLRRPNVHKTLGQPNDVSVAEHLAGKVTLEQAIHKDEKSGADVIFARAAPGSALDLMVSDALVKLVEALRERYDLVVLDTPACLAATDTRFIAKTVDHLLYAVGWNAAPQEAVENGVKQFSHLDVQSLSFVLTNVDVKKYVRYGYGDSVYYDERYADMKG